MADDLKSPLSVDVGFKASVEVKTEIPKEVAGTAVSALLDLIRPWTETRGLRADQIRLQREEVLIKIVRMARQRAAEEQTEIKPISNKTLVPLLEKASLEEDDDENMQKCWATLLLSGGGPHDALKRTFIDILSRVSSKELAILEFICQNQRDRDAIEFTLVAVKIGSDLFSPDRNDEAVRKNAKFLFSNKSFSDDLTPDEVSEMSYDAQKMFSTFRENTHLHFGHPFAASICFKKHQMHATALPPGEQGELQTSLNILERERLADVRTLTLQSEEDIQGPATVIVANITALGVNFVLECSPQFSEDAKKRREARAKYEALKAAAASKQ